MVFILKCVDFLNFIGCFYEWKVKEMLLRN